MLREIKHLILKIAGLITLIYFSIQSLVFGGTCALCKFALTSGGNAKLIQGFYWSILLIAGVPLAVFITVFFYFSSLARKRKFGSHA